MNEDERQSRDHSAEKVFSADPPLPRPASLHSLLVVGGTFDPPHLGHTTLAQRAAEACSIQHVVFVPTNTSPFKMNGAGGAAPHHRLRMMQLAVKNMPNMSVSSFEVDREAPSYTVHTLEALRMTVGGAPEVRLFLGADQALTFHRWFEAKQMLELAEPLVVLRPPLNSWQDLARAGLDQSWRDRVITLPLHDASSTELRARIANGEVLPSAWLAPEVLEYVRAHGLYRNEGRS